jgi:hypothetical protein
MVTDGKLFFYNLEHTPSEPVTRGWKLQCVNATTGESIWSILSGQGIGSPRQFQGAIADGYLAATDKYEGYLYVYGKGQSTTTVTAPDIAISKGTSIVIKGTVLDMSPGQPNTPCVSKDSMELQMEYLHMQQPIGGIFGNETITGVSVILTAIDPNGNYVDIGQTTTDGYYGTFSYTWTPELEGTYEIIASFAGDDSYGSSSAATNIAVSAAPETTTIPTQTPLTMPPFEIYTIGTGVAVIIAVAIVGLLILKKRP